jgi:hypothetical protein
MDYRYYAENATTPRRRLNERRKQMLDGTISMYSFMATAVAAIFYALGAVVFGALVEAVEELEKIEVPTKARWMLALSWPFQATQVLTNYFTGGKDDE